MMILVIGSPKSGKSALAEDIAAGLSDEGKLIYLATMIPCGEEGKERVKRHRALREGKGFYTVERAFDVGSLPDDGGLIEGIRAENVTVLLECAANLCANVMFERKDKEPARCVFEDIKRLKDRVENLIVVTDEFETEEGFDEETRRYIDAVSSVNAMLKEMADRIYTMDGGKPEDI